MMTRFVERYMAPVWLIACLALGGSADAGLVANAALQISAIGLIAFLAASGRIAPLEGNLTLLVALLALAGGLMLLQSVPMPEALWSRLPGRHEVARSIALAGAGEPWLPLSLAPDATLAALLSLLPPLATIFFVVASSRYGRICAIHALVLFAVVSLMLGFEQTSAGSNSSLYLYAFTNRGSPVGFFANRNHLATLFLATIPFAAILAIPARRGDGPGTRLLRPAVGGGAVVLLAIGIVYVGSDAGWALLLPALLGGLAIFQKGKRDRLTKSFGAIAGVATIVAIGLAPLALKDADGKLNSSGSQMRGTIISTTLAAARDYMPVGSGGDSFTAIYPSYEAPEAATTEYINHAHCDYAEIALEYGVPGGVLLMAAFALWIRCFAAAWRNAEDDMMACAAFVAIALIAAHSLVDYPVRTAAIAVVLAMACALLVAPAAEGGRSVRHRRRDRKPGERTTMIDLFGDAPTDGVGGGVMPELR